MTHILDLRLEVRQRIWLHSSLHHVFHFHRYRGPEYYAELLKNIPRLAERRLLSNERSYSDVPGIQGVGDPLARRLQTLLDILANISLCQQRNVSATTACLKGDKGTLETRLYIVFNTKMMKRLVVVLNTYSPSLRCLATSHTSHLQWTAPRRSSRRS